MFMVHNLEVPGNTAYIFDEFKVKDGWIRKC